MKKFIAVLSASLLLASSVNAAEIKKVVSSEKVLWSVAGASIVTSAALFVKAASLGYKARGYEAFANANTGPLVPTLQAGWPPISALMPSDPTYYDYMNRADDARGKVSNYQLLAVFALIPAVSVIARHFVNKSNTEIYYDGQGIRAVRIIKF